MVITTSATGESWDTADWDTSSWAGGLEIQAFWQDATGIGYAVSPHYTVAIKGIDFRLMSTDISFEFGGVL